MAHIGRDAVTTVNYSHGNPLVVAVAALSPAL